jgi:O-antigen biosynthesis protein
VNILFVNYGDFTTNSLNHIAGFANTLCGLGHACAVAVPERKDTVTVIPDPQFIPLTYAEVLENPRPFPDGRPADIVHAWTPREVVRKFILAYQPQQHARLVIHLEDNEEFLLAAWLGQPVERLADLAETEIERGVLAALTNPRRYRHLLRAADGVTVIVDTLRQFVPAGVTCRLLEPGVDFLRYHPQPADMAYRHSLGLRENEKVLVFTGSNTFVNEPEIRDLYLAVARLNGSGVPTRLIRTGFNSPGFQASLTDEVKELVIDLGFVDKGQLPRLLALADVLVQPGRAGPFNNYRLPSKLPEFFSMGKPVILPAANLGLLLQDGVDAILLQTGSPEEIADACRRVFQDPALAQTLGANATRIAREHFDLPQNASRLAEFYATIHATPPRPGSTAAMASHETELSLALRGLASRLPDADDAVVATELAPLVEAMERQEHVLGERLRFEQQISELQRRHQLTEEHVANLTRDHQLTQQHIGNLTRELTAVRTRAATLTRDLTAARHRLQFVEEALRLTRQHAENLENLRRAHQRRIRELEAQNVRFGKMIAIRDEAIGRREDIISQREAKIRSMQDTLSWRLTMPLRFLRRKLLDPWRPPTAIPLAPASPVRLPEVALQLPADEPVEPETVTVPAAISIPYSVDHPQSWSLPPRLTVVRGWCFADDGCKFKAIRALLPDRIVEGTYGLKRLDVLASMRGKAQAEYSGWQFSLELKATDNRLDLEVEDDEGRRHHFFHTGLQIGEDLAPSDLTLYEHWTEAYDAWTAEMLQEQMAHAATMAAPPLISMLVPVFNTPERWLRAMIDSVRSQTYPHWELCLADDASTEPHIRPLLERAAAEDKRIRVCFRDQNGHIAAASNSALALASGEFIALLDHDDELSPNALFEVASALAAKPSADYLYSDEDKIDEEGRRHAPYFKPDWLPDLFYSQNYTSHLSIYRTALVRAVGGFRIGFEGSQDWDLALRVTERSSPDRIVHIPKILYHWRAIPGSTALQLSEKNYPVEAARRALTDHFQRQGLSVQILPVPGDHWRVKYELPPEPPLVSLIIPTRNGLSFLQRCVDSILEKTTYPNFEIVVVDNDSDDPATLAYLATLAQESHPLLRPHHTARVLSYASHFNYSAINNFAVRQVKGELVGLLNNDLEVITPDWLEEMASQALRPEIGCVGAMLYYPNETIQHAGAVLGVGGVAGHAFRDFPRGTEGRFNRARLVQNYSAVTAACLVVRKATYEAVGGFDEKDLAVAFNDIDFCLKVQAAGYRNLWTPFAELYHHESATRGVDDTPEKAERFRAEVEMMQKRWEPILQKDPAYNPNLTLEVNDFSLASPPRSPGF